MSVDYLFAVVIGGLVGGILFGFMGSVVGALGACMLVLYWDKIENALYDKFGHLLKDRE